MCFFRRKLNPKSESKSEIGFLPTLLTAATNIGSLLCDGIGDASSCRVKKRRAVVAMSYNILQAAGTRIFKTDYVACPSCGRTLFNCNDTQRIRAATGHLKGVRIAVMGCIVNVRARWRMRTSATWAARGQDQFSMWERPR